MNSFIKYIVDEVLSTHKDGLENLCIVFPTRRAGLFFQKELSSRLSSPAWSPAVYAIQDFLMKHSGKNIPDDLTLLFELYEAYSKYFPAEDFAKFYPWGELLLRDFDDIDKYLVPADRVFETVTDLQQIDRDFSLDEADLDRLRTFWKNFFDRDPTNLQNEFMNTWKHLGKIYHDFRGRLAKMNIAYEGMAYRDLAERIKTLTTEFPQTIFAGFYALAPAEHAVISHLTATGKAKAYWDGDSYYIDDKTQEAGDFFRKNTLTKDGFSWKRDDFATVKKEIEIAGVPLLVGQAKYAGNILMSLMNHEDFNSERTAVVLPDENLLFPVLYSLPEKLANINVTMGYPLRQTPLYNLFNSLMTLQKNARKESKGDVSFYFRDVKNVLNHPYIQLVDVTLQKELFAAHAENFIRIPAEILSSLSKSDVSGIFIRPESVAEIFTWFKKILRLILEAMKEQGFRFHRLESEFVYHFYKQLRRLEDILSGGFKVDVETFWKIFREIISSVKIPFTGEPLKGLQVMGFLETRVLDFDNVIVLSVNEDILPASGTQPSFIPFNIRKAFGLPTYQEKHAVSAYHFYRLLQRAKNIYLVYNTEAKALTTGEKSRFLLQIEHELREKFPDNISIRKKIISTNILKEEIGEVLIEKNENVLKELSKFLSDGKQFPSKQLSASALMSYIACPLRFYFQYVAGMREPDEIEESMEASTFGSVFHKAIQNLYTGLQELNAGVIEKLKARINDEVDKAIHSEFVNINQLEGKNILLRNILRQLLGRVLENEKEESPVRILQLEKDVGSFFEIDENKTIRLKGIIDRVDEKDGVVRIIDYKSGKVEKKKPSSIEDYFIDPVFKEQFQAFYYSYLSSKMIPGRNIKAGIYILKELSSGIWFLNNGETITQDQFREFEEGLRKLVGEILSPDVPFSQTKETERCKYCAFKAICNRN